MHKIVLDTNIFVSALIKNQSNPGHIIDLVKEKKLVLVLSPDILSEIAIVLSYPKLKKIHGLTLKGIESHLKWLESISQIIIPTKHLEIIEADPSDNIYLECAIEGSAEFIISGDRHLTDLESYEGVQIMNPASFLKIFPNEK